jgi:hypothetical protein
MEQVKKVTTKNSDVALTYCNFQRGLLVGSKKGAFIKQHKVKKGRHVTDAEFLENLGKLTIQEMAKK